MEQRVYTAWGKNEGKGNHAKHTVRCGSCSGSLLGYNGTDCDFLEHFFTGIGGTGTVRSGKPHAGVITKRHRFYFWLEVYSERDYRLDRRRRAGAGRVWHCPG